VDGVALLGGEAVLLLPDVPGSRLQRNVAHRVGRHRLQANRAHRRLFLPKKAALAACPCPVWHCRRGCPPCGGPEGGGKAGFSGISPHPWGLPGPVATTSCGGQRKDTLRPRRGAVNLPQWA